ncbi:MAG: dihydrolipoyl dehydrogenase [Deltaproteobacteria bacterium HGW-Deltaproteobacteria-14]|jgi:dihydrolipoamide dehydrogenase|nr:MAG: dihydrolipoyl dehydrogenase [Deltaproteobacteria bacterium HGW-Deltaproteobacteria-14]
MADSSFDVVVIGSGPGGYVAAIRAAQLGLTAACIERAELGGICLNWGCIPTKALLHSAKLYEEMNNSKAFGFTVAGEITVDWSQVIKRSRQVAKRMNRGIVALFKKYGVTHVEGEASIERPGVVAVGERRIAAKHIIVATGAHPRSLPGVAIDGERVMSYKQALVIDPMPKRVLVVGAGAIGVEFAYFFDAFGSDVTLVEALDHVLPVEDTEVSEALERAFKKKGMKIHTATFAKDITPIDGGGVRVTLAPRAGGEGESIEVDRVLMAVGVTGNVGGLGLEACGVEVERGQIKVDRDLATTCPGIYALGDVAGGPWLAHKASAEAIHCVERIAGHAGKPVDYANIPGCTYCEPQVASVGLTERACAERGLAVKIGKFPFSASGKAVALDEKEGFVKLIFDAGTGEILGAHLIGPSATELIAEVTLARSLEATEAEILGTIHAHPTLAEAIHEAVGQAFGEGVNY